MAMSADEIRQTPAYQALTRCDEFLHDLIDDAGHRERAEILHREVHDAAYDLVARAQVDHSCQGHSVNMMSFFEGGRRLGPCLNKAQYRVFINPPKPGDDGTKRACELCADGIWTTFRREKLQLAPAASQ